MVRPASTHCGAIRKRATHRSNTFTNRQPSMAQRAPDIQTHLIVGHCLWMQINVGKFGDDEVENICLVHSLDFRFEFKELEDTTDI